MTTTPNTQQTDPLLRIDGLTVVAQDSRSGRTRTLLSNVSFDVPDGEVTALVGESGSGKSTVCLAVLQLLASNLAITAGSAWFEESDLLALPSAELRRVRGTRIGAVFQDPLSSLNPVLKIGYQLREPRLIHDLGSSADTRLWARETLRTLGFDDPVTALRQYPGAFSGGMRQRACVAIAYAAEPRLVIADEPTTSLDVSLQGRLLRVLLDYRERHGTAMVLVTHDVNVVRALADRVVVMYGGRVLEAGPTRKVMTHPASPYTHALLQSVPRMDRAMRGRPLPTIAGPAESPGPSAGCPFAPRCPHAIQRCQESFPERTVVGDDQAVWCWNPRS